MKDEYIEDQMWDADQTANMISWGFNGGKILDLGASLGYTSRRLLEYYPNSSVLAIEPNKNIFDFLVENVSDLDVVCINAAITNGSSEITFYETKNPSQGSTFESDYLKNGLTVISTKYVVQGIDFKKLVKVYEPNLIKIDIEGYELFLDFSNLPLSVNTIFMEVHLKNITENGKLLIGCTEDGVHLYSEIIKILFEQGFEYVKIPEVRKDGQIIAFPFNGTWDGSDTTHLVCLIR